jgi:hypothetical protein
MKNSQLKLISCNPQPNQAWLWQTEHTSLVAFGTELRIEDKRNNQTITAKAWHVQAHSTSAYQVQWLSNQAWPTDWQAGDYLQVALYQHQLRPATVTDWLNQPQIWLADRHSLAWVLAAAKERQQAKQAGRTVAPMIALLKHDPLLPVQLKPARFLLDLTGSALGAVALLEDWGVVNRVAHPSGLPGCYEGELADLLVDLLKHLPHSQQAWYVMGQLSPIDQQACLKVADTFQVVTHFCTA